MANEDSQKTNQVQAECSTCSICMEPEYDRPSLLPCSHVYCLKCLENHVSGTVENNKFNCPLCRECFEVPVEGLSEFHSKFNDQKAICVQSDCDICEGKANYKCIECNEYYCDTCTNVHMKMKVSKDHKLTELECAKSDRALRVKGKMKFCQTHPKHELQCEICTLVTIEQHTSTEKQKQITSLVDQLTSNQQRLKENESNLVALEQDIKAAGKKQKWALKEQAEQAIDAIKIKEIEMQRELDERLLDSLNAIKQSCTNIKEKYETADTLITALEKSFGRNSDAEMLDIMKHVQMNLSEYVDTYKTTVFEYICPEKIFVNLDFLGKVERKDVFISDAMRNNTTSHEKIDKGAKGLEKEVTGVDFTLEEQGTQDKYSEEMYAGLSSSVRLYEMIVKDDATNETVEQWIHTDIDETMRHSTKFIGELVRAVCKSAITDKLDQTRQERGTVDRKALTARTTLFKKYIDQQPELELQALKEVQRLVTKLDNPPGMLSCIFKILWDARIVSRSTFMKLETDNSELDETVQCQEELQQFLKRLDTHSTATTGHPQVPLGTLQTAMPFKTFKKKKKKVKVAAKTEQNDLSDDGGRHILSVVHSEGSSESETTTAEMLHSLIVEIKADTDVVLAEMANLDEELTDNPMFVRELTRAVCNSAIIGNKDYQGKDRVDIQAFHCRKSLFQKYINQQLNLELQALYEVQRVVASLDNPPGMIHCIYQTLLSEEIISPSAFLLLETDVDAAEMGEMRTDEVKQFVLRLKAHQSGETDGTKHKYISRSVSWPIYDFNCRHVESIWNQYRDLLADGDLNESLVEKLCKERICRKIQLHIVGSARNHFETALINFHKRYPDCENRFEYMGTEFELPEDDTYNTLIIVVRSRMDSNPIDELSPITSMKEDTEPEVGTEIDVHFPNSKQVFLTSPDNILDDLDMLTELYVLDIVKEISHVVQGLLGALVHAARLGEHTVLGGIMLGPDEQLSFFEKQVHDSGLEFISDGSQVDKATQAHFDKMKSKECTLNEIIEQIKHLYYQSEVPEEEKPKFDILPQEPIPDKILQDVLAMDNVVMCGERYGTLVAGIDKDAEKRNDTVSKLKLEMERIGIKNVSIRFISKDMKHLFRVGYDIEYGSLGAFATSFTASDDLFALLSGHVSTCWEDGKLTVKGKTLGHLLPPFWTHGQHLDIAAAKVDDTAKEQCVTMLKDSSGKNKPCKLFKKNDKLKDLPRIIHLWGSVSSPGLGEIDLNQCKLKDLLGEKNMVSYVLLMDSRDLSNDQKGLCKAGDSGACVCGNDRRGQFVHAIGMIVGELQDEGNKSQYIAVLLHAGLDDLEKRHGYKLRLCGDDSDTL